MLTDPETLKMVTSSFEPKKGTVQAATGSTHFSVHKGADYASQPWWPDCHQRKAFMNTKDMIRLSLRKFRNSCGTSHHPRCNVPLARGGYVPLGFCAEDHGRKSRIVLNLRCSGSASTSMSSEPCGNFTRHCQRPQHARLFGRDSILDRTCNFNCSCKKLMARTSSTRLYIPSLHVFYDVSIQ